MTRAVRHAEPLGEMTGESQLVKRSDEVVGRAVVCAPSALPVVYGSRVANFELPSHEIRDANERQGVSAKRNLQNE